MCFYVCISLEYLLGSGIASLVACIFSVLFVTLCVCVCVCVLNHFSRVQLSVTLWTAASRLLCPWDSPGKNTGVGGHALLQGIFLIKPASLPSNLHLQAGSLLLGPPGKPFNLLLPVLKSDNTNLDSSH